MPEARLQRARAELPAGYQFGHARYGIADLAAQAERQLSTDDRLRAAVPRPILAYNDDTE